MILLTQISDIPMIIFGILLGLGVLWLTLAKGTKEGSSTEMHLGCGGGIMALMLFVVLIMYIIGLML